MSVGRVWPVFLAVDQGGCEQAKIAWNNPDSTIEHYDLSTDCVTICTLLNSRFAERMIYLHDYESDIRSLRVHYARALVDVRVLFAPLDLLLEDHAHQHCLIETPKKGYLGGAVERVEELMRVWNCITAEDADPMPIQFACATIRP